MARSRSGWRSALGEALDRLAYAKLYAGDYSHYIFVEEMKGKHCPVLLELGSHQNAQDVAFLKQKAELIARTIVETLLIFFNLPLAKKAQGERDVFHRWSLEVLANDRSDDPYLPGKFAEHLSLFSTVDERES